MSRNYYDSLVVTSNDIKLFIILLIFTNLMKLDSSL